LLTSFEIYQDLGESHYFGDFLVTFLLLNAKDVSIKVRSLDMPKLTKKLVESIKPDTSSPIKTWDTEIKGFGVITYPSGRKTYCIQYRNQDRIKKRIKIGVHGEINAEIARDKAKQLMGEISQGADPLSAKNDLRDKAVFPNLIHDYLEGHAAKKRPKSIMEDKKLINAVLAPAFGMKKIDAITRKDVEQLHTKMAKTPYQANRSIALLSKMFSLSVAWGWRVDNPAQGIERYQEEKRDRWLQAEELARFWSNLDQYPQNITALLLKFLLLTGARKGEAMGATWDHFDLQQGIWTKPSHMTKQKKKEHLPLSKESLDNLKKLKKSKNVHVFPGKVDGEPLKEIKTFWKKALQEANIKDLRPHDLRHTHASHLVSSGMSLSIVGKLLGHTQASTTQRYAHLADEPLRQAAELFSTKVGNKA